MREGIRKYLLTIVVAFVTASIAAGGTAFAIIANADKVDGYHANELTRLARSSINADALVGTSGTIRQVKIAAPRRGFLFMVASSDVFNFTADDHTTCFLSLDGTELSSTDRTIEVDGAGTNTEENCNTDGSWPVGPGFHTVTFDARGVDADTIYDEATLEVLFVPFNGRGVVPTPVPPARTSATHAHGN